jgi:hypothetical protein
LKRLDRWILTWPGSKKRLDWEEHFAVAQEGNIRVVPLPGRMNAE